MTSTAKCFPSAEKTPQDVLPELNSDCSCTLCRGPVLEKNERLILIGLTCLQDSLEKELHPKHKLSSKRRADVAPLGAVNVHVFPPCCVIRACCICLRFKRIVRPIRTPLSSPSCPALDNSSSSTVVAVIKWQASFTHGRLF